jgi:Fe-S cluster biogenesis protein NfuA
LTPRTPKRSTRSRSSSRRGSGAAVAGDGGDIIFKGFRYGVACLKMKRACSGRLLDRDAETWHREHLLRRLAPEAQAIEQFEA